MKGDISSTLTCKTCTLQYKQYDIDSLIGTNLPIYNEVIFCISNLLLEVEHLIVGLSFEISVTQWKCLLNVTCP